MKLFAVLLSLLSLTMMSAEIDNPARIFKAAKITTKIIRRIEILMNQMQPKEPEQSQSFDALIKEMINDLPTSSTTATGDAHEAPNVTATMARRMEVLTSHIEPSPTKQSQSFDVLIREMIDDLPKKQ